jgi:hypothetical protein
MITAVKTFSRPQNSVVYQANDVINSAAPALLEFLGLENNQGIITKVRITTNKKDCNAELRLHLYSQELAATPDGEQNTVLYSNLDNYVASIDLPPLRTESSSSTGAYAFSTESIGYNNLKGSKMYGVLQTLSTFAPTAGQEFKIELTVIENV